MDMEIFFVYIWFWNFRCYLGWIIIQSQTWNADWTVTFIDITKHNFHASIKFCFENNG